MSEINLHELTAENCSIEKTDEEIKIWCSYDKGYAVSTQKYKSPVVIRAEVMTDSTNIRLLYDGGQLIFNWERNEEELRWCDPGTGKARSITGAGKVPKNTWINLLWNIEVDYVSVSVDGIERYRVAGDFSKVAGQIGIGSAMGSTVCVRSLSIAGTLTDEGTSIPEITEINDCLDRQKKLLVNCADLSGSRFVTVKGEPLYFQEVTLAGTKIIDANLGGLEIDGANLGGAFIHNIGPKMAPIDHPAYNPNARMEPVRFDRCDLNRSIMTNCDLSDIEITNCNISGLKINGILIEDLIREYENKMLQDQS
ncbi:pentapeptide repeat-containing protein [Paenibacillus mesophilus]|uniref:pentapeptide repeat-containing protein n=1 Tax=Paenibacillus mesophilus TaxID=2582849 RepID=UPI001EE3BF77|nr:pentapeptide repeat-containing protein [Paenibacillus mesophilus]